MIMMQGASREPQEYNALIVHDIKVDPKHRRQGLGRSTFFTFYPTEHSTNTRKNSSKPSSTESIPSPKQTTKPSKHPGI